MHEPGPPRRARTQPPGEQHTFVRHETSTPRRRGTNVALAAPVPTPSSSGRPIDCGETDSRHQLAPTYRATAHHASASRTVHDRGGRQWTFFEHETGAPGEIRTSLLAESGNTIRRFDAYPDDWEEMPDEALVMLVEAPVRWLRDVCHRIESRWGEGNWHRHCDDRDPPDDDGTWPSP